MKLKRFLSKTRIIDITSVEFDKALADLIKTVPDSLLEGTSRKEILSDLINRESAISTYLGNGLCMPYARVKGLKQKYVFAAGRCVNGLKFEQSEDYKQTKMLFLLLSNENDDAYLKILSVLARAFSDEQVIGKIIGAPDLESFKAALLDAFDHGKETAQPGENSKDARNRRRKEAVAGASRENKINALIIRSALKISKVARCSLIMLQGDSFADLPGLAPIFGDAKVCVMTEKTSLKLPEKWSCINVRSFSDERLSQLKSAIMIGLTRGLFSAKDKICCIGGIRGSNQIDSIVALDIGKEISDVFINQKNMLPENVKPEVIERIIDIATELSVEGREGKPVGCIFVIGNTENLKPHLKQLILNPFYGYKPEDRNVLNPFMDETVKEYSLIDGAFIVDGGGILEAAGALIHTPDFKLQLPGGLGARHAAAYAISLMADCVSIVVSSSTGQVTLFRKGQAFPITEKRKK